MEDKIEEKTAKYWRILHIMQRVQLNALIRILI